MSRKYDFFGPQDPFALHAAGDSPEDHDMATEALQGHTPGPWTFEQIDHGHATGTIETRTSNPILRLHAASAEGGASFEANARLIAAAPEMLEALQAAMEAVDYYHEHEGFGETRQMIRAAIARATNGGSQ